MSAKAEPGPQPVAAEEARQQALDYLGFLAPRQVKAGDKVYEIPAASLLSREQQRRYNELQFSLESLDRWPDLKNADGEVIRLGEPKLPHRTKAGELLEDYDVRLTMALLGDLAGEEYLSNGGLPGDINLFWAESNQRVAERRASDSKSVGSDSDLAPVPETD